MSKYDLEKCKGCVSENNNNCPVLKMPDVENVDEWFSILDGAPCPVKVLTKEAKAIQEEQEYYTKKELQEGSLKRYQGYSEATEVCGTCIYWKPTHLGASCRLRDDDFCTFGVKGWGTCRFWTSKKK